MTIRSKSRRATRVAYVLAPLALATSASAQVSTLDIHDTISAAAALAGVDPTAQFTATAVGDLDDNLDLEVVSLVDGDLLVCMNVSVSTASFRLDLGGDAQALAIQYRVDHPDRIVVAKPAGIEVFELDFDFANQQVVPTGVTLYSQPELQSVQGLLVGTPGSAGTDQILVLGNNGQDLRILNVDPVDASLQLDPVLQASAQGPIWSMDWVNIDADPLSEVVTLGSHGLEIVDLEGPAAGFFPHSAAEGALAVPVPETGVIAWARRTSAGPWELLQMQSDGTVLDQRLLDIASVSSLEAVRLGPAGISKDLVAVDSAAGMLNVVVNSASPVEQLLIGSGRAPVPGNLAQVAAADFDHDGHLDLAVCDSSEQALDLYLNDGWPNPNYSLTPSVYYLSLRAARDKVVWLFDGDEQGDPLGYPAGANRVSIRVFNVTPGDGVPWSEPLGHPLPASSLIVDWANETHATFPLKSLGIGDDYIAFVEVRYIQEDTPGGSISHKFPVYWFALVDGDNQAAQDYLEDAYPFQAFDPGSIGNGDAAAGETNPPKGHPPGPGGG